jgi:hypothetical protein
VKRWMLIKSSEDGDPITWLTDGLLDDLLAMPRDWGVERFMSFEEADRLGHDTNYWPDGAALLVRFEAVVPEVAASAWRLP